MLRNLSFDINWDPFSVVIGGCWEFLSNKNCSLKDALQLGQTRFWFRPPKNCLGFKPVVPLSLDAKKVIFSIFIRISHSTWEEKQHLAKQHLLLRKRLLAAFRDTYVKKWKTLVKTSSLFSRVKIRRIFTLKRDFYCDARLENIQKVSKRAKIWQFMTFLENVW